MQFTRLSIITLLLLIVIVITVPLVVLFYQHRTQTKKNASGSGITNLLTQHFLGGFTINTTDKVFDAASDGLQIALYYGGPAHSGNQLEQALKTVNMKEIDGYISSTLFYYECHKSKVFPDPSDPKKTYRKHNYCKTDNYPFFTDDNAVLASVSAHLHSVAANSLIVGYWVLDDQALWDTPGYAINILNQAHTLIQQITPGKATICGYGGFLGVNKKYSWDRPLALNFTSQGCDMVGWYIYSSPQQNSNPPVDTNTFDWTMSGLLANMSADLQTQGWNMQKTPLIGIPQGWAGTHTATSYEATPSAQNMQTQAESFCKYGAQGIIWYAWGNSPPINQFPWNNITLKQGVRQGVRACQNYWN